MKHNRHRPVELITTSDRIGGTTVVLYRSYRNRVRVCQKSTVKLLINAGSQIDATLLKQGRVQFRANGNSHSGIRHPKNYRGNSREGNY